MPGITDPAEAYFKDGQWGWDGTQWRKLPLVFGYSGLLGILVSDTDLAAGSVHLPTSTVPAGYLWIVTNINMRYIGTPPTRMTITMKVNGLGCDLLRQLAPVSDTMYSAQGWWICGFDDYLDLYIVGATATDDAHMYVTGFTMAIAE